MRKVHEPPKVHAGKGRPPQLLKEAAMMVKNPGQWYEVKQCPTSGAAATSARLIRTGSMKAFQDGGFEAVSRSGIVYARYTGEK
jgi:hypothetical protein